MPSTLELLGNYFELLCKLALIGIFLTAGIAKLFDPEGSLRAMINFGVPEKYARFAALTLPIVEIVLVVVFLLNPEVLWYGALGCLILLLVFTIMMLVQMARGSEADCHCFGQLYSRPVGAGSILKNLLIMVPAVFLLFRMPIKNLAELHDWLNESADLAGPSMYFIFGIAIIALLFVVIFYLRKNFDEFQDLSRRFDEMEKVPGGSSGGHQHHEHMTSPDEGLPIGAPAPDFDLPNLQGRAVSFEQLMMRGRSLLFLFISPTCAPCKALLPQVGKWQEELAGKVDFIFVSAGSADENAAKLPQLGGQTLLLQKKREVADLFKAKWTPTAILVNADGVIASRPAPGDAAITDLIDLIKENTGDVSYVANGRGMSPNELKIGETLPEFSLPDTKGERVSDDLIRGQKTLVLFWGLDCPHCQRMLPEVKDWEAAGTNGAQLVVFSSGDAEKNRELNLRSPVLLDDKGEVGEKLGMFGTPSAVLIDESGKIVSETAVGSEQIWSLIGKRK